MKVFTTVQNSVDGVTIAQTSVDGVAIALNTVEGVYNCSQIY
jgi:hypothetical protein